MQIMEMTISAVAIGSSTSQRGLQTLTGPGYELLQQARQSCVEGRTQHLQGSGLHSGILSTNRSGSVGLFV